MKLVEEVTERQAPGSTVRARMSGEAFLTPPGPLYDVLVSAIEEETHRVDSGIPIWRRFGRKPQTPEGKNRLAVHPERRPAGRQDLDTGAGPHHALYERAYSIEQMLAVVD